MNKTNEKKQVSKIENKNKIEKNNYRVLLHAIYESCNFFFFYFSLLISFFFSIVEMQIFIYRLRFEWHRCFSCCCYCRCYELLPSLLVLTLTLIFLFRCFFFYSLLFVIFIFLIHFRFHRFKMFKCRYFSACIRRLSLFLLTKRYDCDSLIRLKFTLFHIILLKRCLLTGNTINI